MRNAFPPAAEMVLLSRLVSVFLTTKLNCAKEEVRSRDKKTIMAAFIFPNLLDVDFFGAGLWWLDPHFCTW